jgi:hypothetical protein
MIDAVLAAKRPICGRWHRAEDTEVRMKKKNALYADPPTFCEGVIIPLAFLDNDAPEPNCADKSMNSMIHLCDTSGIKADGWNALWKLRLGFCGPVLRIDDGRVDEDYPKIHSPGSLRRDAGRDDANGELQAEIEYR